MIFVKNLSNKYNLKIVGESKNLIDHVCTLENQSSTGLSWIKNDHYLEKVKKGFFITNTYKNLTPIKNITFLITKDDPKKVFSLVIKDLFTPGTDFYLKDETELHRKNKNIFIAPHVFIGTNVKIGEGTIIHSFVCIEANSIIGKNCIIKPNTSIGTDGLGMVLDKKSDTLIKFPQIGNVVMGNNIEIGPNSTVRRGALTSTIIKDGSKIGAQSNIGHNCIIGKNTILTCSIVTAGSSEIGDYVTIGVNSVIRNGVKIGNFSNIGMGSVVTKSIPANVVAFGNPAKVISEIK